MHISIEISNDTPQRELQALRAMLDSLQGSGVGQAPLPVIPAVPSTAGASPSPIAPGASTAGAANTSPPGASAPAASPAAGGSADEQTGSATWPQANPAGIVVDVRGLPWDERIHSSNKQCGQNGKWMKRRGMNDEGLTKQIEGELMATMQARGPAPVDTASAAAAPVVLPPGAQPLPDMTQAAATPPVLPPGAQPLPVAGLAQAQTDAAQNLAQGAAAPSTFQEFMPLVTDAQARQVLTQDDVANAMQAFGLPNAFGLVKRPDLLPQIWAALKSQFPTL